MKCVRQSNHTIYSCEMRVHVQSHVASALVIIIITIIIFIIIIIIFVVAVAIVKVCRGDQNYCSYRCNGEPPSLSSFSLRRLTIITAVLAAVAIVNSASAAVCRSYAGGRYVPRPHFSACGRVCAAFSGRRRSREQLHTSNTATQHYLILVIVPRTLLSCGVFCVVN